jgi:hypothetical protein
MDGLAARLEQDARLGELQAKYADCCEELARARGDAATIMHALDCSTQLIEALIAWLPEGLALSPEVVSAKGAWSVAMQKVIR